MLNKNLLRKSIFRNELNYVFEKYKLNEYDRQKVVSRIFENPLEISLQYLLKEEINDIEKLREKLKEIIKDENIIVEIITLFMVQDDLKLPPEIKDIFVNNKKVAAFIGAGVSKLLGLPLWKELADAAIEYLFKQHRINYFEYKKILNEVVNPKEKMTIFHEFIPKNQSIDFYKEIFSKPDYSNGNLYETLVKFGWVKISSNIDDEFYKALQNKLQSLISQKEDFNSSIPAIIKQPKRISNNFHIKDIDYNAIYQIHGCLDNLNETVLTTRDYVEAYYRNKNGLQEFLTALLKEYTTIFIGYSLEEFELLSHIIKIEEKDKKAEKEEKEKLFVLVGIYSNELSFSKIIKKYFKNLNIKPILYYLDFNGYHRLNDVLNSWYQLIEDTRRKDYYQKIKKIDEAID